MLEKATINDLSTIMEIIKQVVCKMKEDGLDQWNEYYPSSEIIREDIIRDELFVLKEKGVVKGIVVLNEKYDEAYNSVKWNHKTKKNLYVHRLCVAPMNEGRGMGKKIMNFVKELAVENGYEEIRLDCYVKNIKANFMYERLGYYKHKDRISFVGKVFNVYEMYLL